MNGKLYVIDGLDGCGKSTQAELTLRKLTDMGYNVKLISFPDYKEESSALVRMYLNGEFGENANDVNAYAASSFYAVDRYASYKKHWQEPYERGTIILASRYVSSNVLHQMSKLEECEWSAFLDWLDDFEYTRLGLPKPNAIIYLNMNRDVADRLILSRYEGDESKKDIHENNKHYLARCGQAANFATQTQGWYKIDCSDENSPYDPETINKQILDVILTDLR